MRTGSRPAAEYPLARKQRLEQLEAHLLQVARSATGAVPVRLRVIWLKSAYLTFSVTVRPRMPAALAIAPDLVDDRLQLGARRLQARTGRCAKVFSAPTDLRIAVRPDRPFVDAAGDPVVVRARLAEMLAAGTPAPALAGRRRCGCQAGSSSPPSPGRRRGTCRPAGPRRRPAPSRGVMTNSPSGLCWSEASLARNLL